MADQEAQESLSPTTRQVIKWLTEKWGSDRPCPYCGDIHWLVDDGGLLLRYQTGVAYPVVAVSCANCAQTTFINMQHWRELQGE